MISAYATKYSYGGIADVNESAFTNTLTKMFYGTAEDFINRYWDKERRPSKMLEIVQGLLTPQCRERWSLKKAMDELKVRAFLVVNTRANLSDFR
jgi:hypothetical protein